jgi:ATP-dependent DNA helicase RecG
MKSQEKENIMNEFKLGKLKILVATSIIEVGVDVPDATIMIIENAEQFGLAQLHQMRGRVGRSNLQSYCILMYNSNYVTEDAIKRFKILRESNDGFYIAEQDLLLRGAGELTGTKQSGDSSFHFSDILEHSDVILEAREIAKQIIKDSNKEHINYRISLFKNYQHLDQ